ncbi:ATP-binding protein [Sphingobium terrigena]|uniref:ATP-binding protein n=1 Tax=Sphingobium terrigena TaxID=2304063 RepID=UPI001601CBA7|nr:DUF87 domain-containing protein [Sphingobium terrigena]
MSAEDAAEAFDFLLRLPHLFTLEEAHDLVRLPFADDEGLPGFETEPVPPFTVPSIAFLPAAGADGAVAPPPADKLRLGMVQRPGAPLSRDDQPLANTAWHAINPTDLTKHALIVGSTGSGKTTATMFLVRELIRLRVPFLVIEPVKTEYFGRLENVIPKIRRRNFEGAPTGGPGKDFLAFDPLRVPKGISIARHASYLKSCFEAAFPMEPVTAMLVEKGLIEYYTGMRKDGCCGFGKFDRGGPHMGSIRADGAIFPSYASFKAFITGPFVDREFSAPAVGQSRAHEMRDIFRRRFENLSLGILGTSFELADAAYRHFYRKNGNRPDPAYYDLLARDLLTWPTVVELDAVPDADQKALAMAFLMTYIFEYRQAEDLLARETGQPLAEVLRHLLIIEEAHRLLANQATASRGAEQVGEGARGKSVGLFVDMLAEIRAFGQGLAIVEQIPSKIVPEAVKNTSLKIMLRLAAKDDRDSLGAAMNFTEAQKRYVTLLKVDKPRDTIPGRVNFVLFEEGLEQPLLLHLPLSGTSGPEARPFDEFF